MKKVTILFLAIMLSVFSFADNAKINLKNSENNQVYVTENTYNKLAITNSVSVVSLMDIATEQGSFSKLRVEGYTKNLSYGSPLLPVKREMIEIPVGAKAVVNIISYNVEELDLTSYNVSNKLFPSQPPASKSIDEHEFVYNPDAYDINSFTETELVKVDVLGFMRGLRVGRIEIAPFSYNPVTNTLKVYNDITFEVIFEQADISATMEMKAMNNNPFFSGLGTSFLNYKPLGSRENFMRYPIKYVIVADPMFETQLQPFVEWKTKKGFTVIEAYTDDPNVGSTTVDIKAYLEGLYNAGTADDPAPSFVLFVGDIAQVPAFTGTAGGHVTDLYYCEYTGDHFPEVYYGRWSAESNTDLQPQIDKTLQYEQYTMPDPSYLDDVLLVSGMDGSFAQNWGNGQINYGTINYFNADHGINASVYLYPESGSHSADIIQDVSDGVSFGNYTAHCSAYGWADPSFSISDVAGLQNQDEYCVLIGNCCSSNEYNNYCFGEAILRAENKGAIGYIGGSNSTYWDEDYYFGVGVGTISENPPPYEETTLGNYDRVFHDHGEDFEDWYVSTSEMIFAGNLAVTEAGSSLEVYYWEIYCVMGDPSVMVYMSQPDELTATYTPIIPLGATTFTVNTEPYAYIGLSMDGVLYGAGLSDATGLAEITIDPFTTPGNADLVITKQNFEPLIETIIVSTPNGPFLAMQDHEINDELGNNNGIVDFGEDILIDVAIANYGTDDANNVTATLTSTDELITINDDTEDYGTIASQDTVWMMGAYAFTVDAIVPDQHIVSFELSIEDNSKELWNSTFNVTLNAPELMIGYFTVDDSQGGNGNGRLDAGETADIIVDCSNMGHCDAMNSLAELATSSSDIIINVATFNLDTLASDETAQAVFNITVGDDVPTGTSIEMNMDLASGDYTANKVLSTSIGLTVEDWESAGFETFYWQFDGDKDWEITNETVFEGVYSAVSGDISDMQDSELVLYYDVANADTLSFYKRVSCEDDPWNDNWDYLAFYIDGAEKGRWDGEVDWSREAYFVAAGEHEFKWVFHKDQSVSNGADCGWIDWILFPPLAEYVGLNEIKGNLSNVRTYPNPFTNSTTVRIMLEETSDVSIQVYNLMGQEVASVINQSSLSEGIHEFTINGAELGKGIFNCIISTNNQKVVQKLIVLE